MGGEDPVLPFEELQTDPRIGRARSIGAQRIVRRLEDDRGWRVDSGARRVEQAANAVGARDRRHTFNQFGSDMGMPLIETGNPPSNVISRRAGASGSGFGIVVEGPSVGRSHNVACAACTGCARPVPVRITRINGSRACTAASISA